MPGHKVLFPDAGAGVKPPAENAPESGVSRYFDTVEDDEHGS